MNVKEALERLLMKAISVRTVTTLKSKIDEIDIIHLKYKKF